MIETIVLDLGGVAARFHPERRLEALASLSRTTEKAIEELIFDSGLEHRAELGAYSLEEVLANLWGALDYQGSDTALIEAWALAFEPDNEILEYVASLGSRKAVFTNNGPMLDACLAGPLSRLAAVFDEIICSWHLRACKRTSLRSSKRPFD